MKTTIVVGDKFEEFAQRQEHVITLTELENKIWEQRASEFDQIIIGQGVCRHRLSTLRDVMHTQTGDKTPTLLNLDQVNDQVDPRQMRAVHKVRRENVLISMPRQREDGCFVSKLAIHDAAELLSDHMTGQHVQGMVLTEAARQMMLSVSELYLLQADERNLRYFVLHDVSSRYHQFAFPIDTELELSVLSQERKRGGALCVEIKVRFLQQAVELAEVTIRYAAYDKHFIAEREHHMATTRLSAYLDAKRSQHGVN